MKRIASFLFVLFVAIGCITACSSAAKFETITTDKAIKLIDNGAVILDVRTEEEYNREHIPNAINVPLDRLETIDIDKNETLVVYCQSGARSLEAVKTLSSMGYNSLYNLDGGLLNWGGELEE